MLYLNTVIATVTLAGKVVHFVNLELEQGFNRHHTCKILVNYEELDKSGWMGDPVGILKNIGEPIMVEFRHKQTNEKNTFFGIINNITFLGKHGQQNNILFQGISETIKLDGKPSMDSFTDQILKNIVSEVVDNSGNGAKVTSEPQYDRPIEYLSMWNETCFNFLNRLSSLYGEAFYSDNGSNIYFGLPMSKDFIPIVYDVEMTSMQLEASLKPARFQQYDYSVKSDKEWLSVTDQVQPKTTGYQKVVTEKSDLIFNMENNYTFAGKVDMHNTMMEMTDMKRTRDIAGMLVLNGTTQTCKIGIGKVINVVYPKGIKVDTTSGDFLITYVKHSINQEGTYENSFSGVRADLRQIPLPDDIIKPQAGSHRAIVKDNADPEGMGRVRIQFQWQQQMNKMTNWIRVQSPDAGGESRTGRGFIFIPEVGDEVMVNFVNADPSRPYVSGSMFPKSTARGGLEDNHLKSIITRSGHTVQFDDSDGSLSITIKDRNGNIIHLDSKEKNIEIIAPETITLTATDVKINASNNIEMQAEASIKADAMADIHIGAQDNIDIATESDIQMKSIGSTSLTASSKMEIVGQSAKVTSDSETELSGMETTVKGQTTVISGSSHKAEFL